ncbi:hypothetical protein AAY55_16825 [Vibrio metoecus]|uniref:Uncharacterized protein n=1 Tax=Vibrio metoecus TaxID=1481663 RepID=A0A0N8UHE1_VIBMT|nr:hypothetical protein AAY55_16825 [Vibrio metoecus]
MAQSGMKDVIVERFDPLGFPVLVVEATSENNTKARLIYVGTNIANQHYHYYICTEKIMMMKWCGRILWIA